MEEGGRSDQGGGVETKVDVETRLLRSQMEEENSAFKARLETLERMVT